MSFYERHGFRTKDVRRTIMTRTGRGRKSTKERDAGSNTSSRLDSLCHDTFILAFPSVWVNERRLMHDEKRDDGGGFHGFLAHLVKPRARWQDKV
jgi:hypothetical protein